MFVVRAVGVGTTSWSCEIETLDWRKTVLKLSTFVILIAYKYIMYRSIKRICQIMYIYIVMRLHFMWEWNAIKFRLLYLCCNVIARSGNIKYIWGLINWIISYELIGRLYICYYIELVVRSSSEIWREKLLWWIVKFYVFSFVLSLWSGQTY